MNHLSRLLRRLVAPALSLLCGLLVAFFAPAWAAAPRSVELYLSEAPPLSMMGQPGEHGILGEATVKAAALAGYDLKMVSLPWPRAQRTVRLGTDQLIIPLSRTPEREADYTWIAPIMTMDRAFFSLDKHVDTYAQARQTFSRIAVGMGSAQEQKLRDEGFSKEQIYPLKIGENPAQLLLLGRVDAWFNGVPETRYIWPKVSSRRLQMSPPLMTADLYLACSKTCDAALVHDFRKAIEALRKDGTLQQLADAYQKDLSLPAAPAR